MKTRWLMAGLICLLMSPDMLAQIKLKSYTSATDTFYWKRYLKIPEPQKLNLRKISVSGQQQVIQEFMDTYKNEYPQFTSDSGALFTLSDWKKTLHAVDINQDGLADILFSGSGGGESDMIRLYLNQKNHFDLIFEDYQYLTDWKTTNKKLTSLQTADQGCCAEYLVFTRNYSVHWEEHNPGFVKGKQIVWYQKTELPARFYDHPVPFIAMADTLTLRASASRIDEPFNPVLENFGNIIAKYRTKCRGTILAKKLTEKTNEWYFVEINPDVLPSASILYNLEKQPTFIRGWVSALSIKVN